MKKNYKVLISAPYLLPFMDRFSPIFKENNIDIDILDVEERLSEEDLLRLIPGVDGLICGDDQFSEAVYKKADSLKVLSKWGTGIDSLKLDLATKYNVKITNTPNAFTIPVSETVMANILLHSRKTVEMNEAMHAGVWKKIPGKTLHESTLGIVGFGNIGKEVARRAIAFNMKVLIADTRYIGNEIHAYPGATHVTLDQLLEHSDYVSINCDLNDSSFQLADKEFFKKMKKTALFINTARGPIVKESDLINALKDKEIDGAALDVFEVEPLPKGHPFFDMKNVIMAPHNSNSSKTAWEFIHVNTINNMIRALEIENPKFL